MKFYTEFVRVPYKCVNVRNKKYINECCSFDIETSSFLYLNCKRSNMYIWQFAIKDSAYYGRTWDDLRNFFKILTNEYNLNENKKMIIYVHNLGYEFQYLCGQFEIKNVFSRTSRHPMKFEIDNFIFKDSYILSGLSLEKTLIECNSQYSKMLGDLDYTKLRHSKTILTNKEMKYCENDVLGLNEFIKSEIEKNDNNITKIPMTKTGYVRQYTRKKCFKNKYVHKSIIDNEFVTDDKLFKLLNNAYSGGYVHANPLKIGQIINNVASIDFTSSYPTVMISHKYPRSKFRRLNIKNIETLNKMCNKYACVFSVMFKNIEPTLNVHILSTSKCLIKGSRLEDNGRLVSGENVVTNCTNVDWYNICKCYKWEQMCIKDFYYARQDYLPQPIIESVLDLFKDKTTLKGVKGKESEYLVKKGMLNGIYGMCVTNQFKNEVEFDNITKEWIEKAVDLQEKLLKEKDKKNTFLCYQWGVWVSAWARYELIDGIINIGEDYIYSDTDSIKFTNYTKHTNYINNYNKYVINLLEKALTRYNIDVNRISATKKDGTQSTLGLWDFECVYDKFKTLGCKRYTYCINNEFNFTISGLPKNCKYFDKFNTINKKFNAFNDFMCIDENLSNKLTSTYINDEYSIYISDYLGNYDLVSEKTYIHLSQQPFSLNLADMFIEYLQGIGNSVFKFYNTDIEEKELFINNEKSLL